MFEFLKSRKDPLAHTRAAQRWLESGVSSDTLALHGQLMAELARVNAPAARFTPRRLAALFVVDSHADQLFKSLTAQYVDHANRSAKIERQIWTALFDLTHAFQTAYQAYQRVVSDAGHNSKWRTLMPELICRQIVHLGRDAKARLYRYESWMPGRWSELHSLLALATTEQLERLPIALARDGPATSIEHQYLMIVVLQLIDTGNLTPRQIEHAWEELDGWCGSLRLTLGPKSVSSFYVDLASREGLKRRPQAPLEGSVLFIDTQPLHAVMMQHEITLEQLIRTQTRADEVARLSDQLSLLKRFAVKVDPEYRPLARHGERTPATGSVDAIVGLAKIAGFLREEDRDPDFQLYAGKSFGTSLELAVFGRVRNERDRRAELARHRLAQYAAAGPWELKDISQTGFRLIAPLKSATVFPIGMLVAIRPLNQPKWTLGIVRRMRRLTSDRTEIGLQIIASAIAGVDLVEQRRTADTDYLVDGEDGTINGRSFVALFLTLKKSEADAGVQSLIVPTSEYQPGKRLTLVTAKSIYRVVLGGSIEQQPEWVWIAVEPQEIGAQIAVAPAGGGESHRPH